MTTSFVYFELLFLHGLQLNYRFPNLCITSHYQFVMKTAIKQLSFNRFTFDVYLQKLYFKIARFTTSSLKIMKIELTRQNQGVHFQAASETSDIKVQIDGPESIGGEGKGVRPMEMVLMALGSCSVFDLTTILQKQRQQVEDIHVEVEGQRREEIPNIFTHIHIGFRLKGTIDREKAERAAELAVKKYCSVHDMLAQGGVEITYSLQIDSQ